MVTVELAWWQADAIVLTNAGDKPEEEVMLSMNLWARSSRITMMIRTKILALVCSAAGLPPFLALEGGSRSEQSIPSILVSAGSAFDAHCQLHEEWHGSGSSLVEKKRCCLGGIGFRGHGEFPIGGSWKEGQIYIQKRSLLFRRYLYMSSETTNTSYIGGLACIGCH
jgi:hypothetical protein